MTTVHCWDFWRHILTIQFQIKQNDQFLLIGINWNHDRGQFAFLVEASSRAFIKKRGHERKLHLK